MLDESIDGPVVMAVNVAACGDRPSSRPDDQNPLEERPTAQLDTMETGK